MMDTIAVSHQPVVDFLHVRALIPHIGGTLHKHTVAAGRAEGVHHQELALRILLLQQLGSQKGVVHRVGHTRAQCDVQHILSLS